MKIKAAIKLLCLSGIISMMSLSTLAQDTVVATTTTGQYIDVSALSLPFSILPSGYISPLQSPGELLAPFGQVRSGYAHQGIDIRAAEGTPIFAIADGIVTKAAPDSKGVDNGGGHMIFVDFGSGAQGRYMHLSNYGVQAGDTVKAGQVIGFTGNTGESTTPHLHFEYRVNGVLQDPTFLFEEGNMILGQATAIAQPITLHEPFFVVQG